MAPFFSVVQIVLSVVLILLILLQAKGSGFSGAFFSDSSAYRSRRGVERTMFNLTIGVSVTFVLISIIAVKIS